MRAFPMLVALILSVALLTGCAMTGSSDAGGSPAEDARVIQAERFTLYALGLSCPLCAHNLDKTLLEIDGIESAEVNLADGSVIVRMRPGTSVTVGELRRMVEGSGFTFDRVETPTGT
ncbi:MAG: heavy metal-associated domain-containing protein [Phycisphaeraceae bacterium]